MSKYVVMPKTILDELVKAAGWSPETTLERPLTEAQERAGDEEEWCVVNKCKLMELLDDGNEHSPAMRLFKKQEAIKYLATPQGKEGEK